MARRLGPVVRKSLEYNKARAQEAVLACVDQIKVATDRLARLQAALREHEAEIKEIEEFLAEHGEKNTDG